MEKLGVISFIRKGTAALTVFLLLCSMSECDKQSALRHGYDLDFTIEGLEGTSQEAEQLSVYGKDVMPAVVSSTSLSWEAELMQSVIAVPVDFGTATFSIRSAETIAAGTQCVDGQDGASVDISLVYTSGGTVHTAQVEDAALRVVLMSSKYATGTFSGNVTLKCPQDPVASEDISDGEMPVPGTDLGTDGAVTFVDVPCRIVDGFFNILLQETL